MLAQVEHRNLALAKGRTESTAPIVTRRSCLQRVHHAHRPRPSGSISPSLAIGSGSRCSTMTGFPQQPAGVPVSLVVVALRRVSGARCRAAVLAPTVTLSLLVDCHGRSWRVADRFYAVVVGVEHKSGIVVRVIVRPKAGCAVIAPTCTQRRGMKSIYGCSAGRAEAEMDAGIRRGDAGFRCYCEFNARRPGCRAIVRTSAASKIYDADESKGGQGGIIELPATDDVRNAGAKRDPACGLSNMSA